MIQTHGSLGTWLPHRLQRQAPPDRPRRRDRLRRGLARRATRGGPRALRPDEDVSEYVAEQRKGGLRSPQDFTTLLSHLGKRGQWRHALAAFDEMKEVGLQPSVYSSSALVQALGRARQWQRALQIFEDSLEQVDADCALYSSAMKACDMDYDRVLTLMDDMVASGIKPDLQSYGIAIGSCCSSQQWQEALDLLLGAEEKDLEPNAKTVSLVMKTMTGQEQWERSLQLWHRFGEAELKVDAMAFTTAIQACAGAKLWRHALGLLEDMHREDLNPGAIPTSVAISACNGVSEWEVAVELFRSARESREAMDSIIYNAAMQSCGEGGLWKEAIQLFQQLEAESMAPTAQSYGALMTAMHKSGTWQKGLVAFTAMKEAMARSLKVDVKGFSAAVNVAEAAKKWPLAVHLLMQEMPDHEIAPDTLSFNSAISAAERSRKWRVAIALLQEMKDLDVARDVESYAGAILACVAGKQWSRGLNLLDLMATDDLEADAQSYGFVAFFHIAPETVSSSMSKEPPPEVKQLIDFFAGPAGLPLGPRCDPDRSLASRLSPGKKKDIQSGIFKANAKCLNPEDVNVPEMLHEYNGKPCLITKSGYIVKDPDMEWVEIGIDVRGWNILVRKMLCSYRDMIPRTKVHFGFLVQGIEDDELPEGLMCDVYVYGANIIDNPAKIKLDS